MKKPNILSLFKAFLPESSRNRLKKMSLYYSRRHCPICGQYQHADFKLYKPHMPQCPHCHSLSRHRFVWLYFATQINLFNGTEDQLLLYFAPEYGIYSRLERISKIKCTSVNIHPMKLVKVSALMDITHLGTPSNSFDLIYCSHVLEHVIDDQAAMKELYRVLKPGGSAIILVPIRDGQTLEDFSVVDPIERERIFGQNDHVRWYGLDILDRFDKTGFQVKMVYPEEIITKKMMERCEIPEVEPPLFHCIK